MNLVQILVFLWSAVPVLADYGQTSRCYVAEDGPTNNFLGNFLKNGSSCITEGKENILACLDKKLDRDAVPLLSPLIDVIRRWERYYGIEMHKAFADVGRSNDPNDWNAWSRDRDWNVWERLHTHWAETGWLCFYDHNPRLSNTLQPRDAGLLTLFFSDKNGLRSPILKSGRIWRFDPKYHPCAATLHADRVRQIKIVSRLADNVKNWGASSWQTAQEAQLYRDTYSTDPFLQAVITGWFAKDYTCPAGLECQSEPGDGKIWLPRNGMNYLNRLAKRLISIKETCIVLHGPLPPSSISANTLYVAVNGTEWA
ncbi:hypothetical protein CDD83_7046 [Cordyceps sp. RAO-2017]|nr:hypothetical protein CDD83_7046 [Cordyceps sp. RAO-2017]